MKKKNNLYYQLASVFIAMLLWVLIQGEEILEINKKVKVQVASPEGYGVKGGEVFFKDATVSGPRATLAQLPKDFLRAKVSVENTNPSPQKVRLDKKNLSNWNNRIKITIHDAYLNFTLDKKVKKKVQIKENLHGLPHPNYIIEKVVLKPTSTYIEGLQSDLEKIETIFTEPIDVSQIQSSVSLQTKFLKEQGLRYTTTTVTAKARIQVGEKKINKTYRSIPLEIVGASTPYKLLKKHVDIVIQSTHKNLELTDKNDLQAFVDIQNLSPGNHQRQVQVKIPPRTALIEVTPEIVAIEVYKDTYMR